MLKRVSLFSALLLILAATACSKSPWVAKVDGEKITLDDLNNAYYALNKTFFNFKTNEDVDKAASDNAEKQRNASLDKKIFLDEMIKQKLILMKSEKEGITKDDEFKLLEKIIKESTASQYLVKMKILDKIEITDQEIQDVFTTEKDAFKGATLDQARNYIKQQLTQKKFGEETNKYVTDLKDKAKLEKNNDVITAISDPDVTKHPKEGFIAKIDGKEISVKEFNDLYYIQIKNIFNLEKNEEVDKLAADTQQVKANPFLNRSVFIEELIKQKIVFNQAVADKITDNPELESIINYQLQTMALSFYIKKKFSKDIEVTPQEVEETYQREQARFKGVPVLNATEYITQALKGEKFQKKMNAFITDLKDAAKIEKNLEVLDKPKEEKK